MPTNLPPSLSPSLFSYEAQPRIVGPVLEAIDGVSRAFLGILARREAREAGEAGEEVEEATPHQEMEQLVAINQGLLQALGVSHPALQQVRGGRPVD